MAELGAAALAASCLVLALGAAPAFADSCPNAQFRTGYSAYLPDCRAYEQATPVDKGEQDAPHIITGSPALPQAAADGDRVAYFSFGGFSGAPAPSSFYLGTRGASGWSTQGITPPQSTTTHVVCDPGYVAYSGDLSRGILVEQNSQLGCGTDDPPLVPGEPQDVVNLFVRDNDTGAYQLVSLNPVFGSPADAGFQGGSPDLTHVVFDERAQLTSDATSGDMLYEWAGGSVSLVGQIPTAPATSCSGASCTPVAGARLGGPPPPGTSLTFPVARAVSADGSRVFFTANGNLYLREGDTTTEVDAVTDGSGTSGGGHFTTATADGSSVFFTDDSKLTVGSTATSGHPDLYRYDVGSGDLTDLTVDTADVNGAAVQGVVGASDDGSYLYFVANGVLAANANSHGDTASAGDCAFAAGSGATGECNLYLLHGGTTSFIATLAGVDLTDWGLGTSQAEGKPWTSRVTPDGLHVAFDSVRSLTGYDNTPPDPSDCVDATDHQSPCTEVFLYDAGSGQLNCASCNPSGAQPLGSSTIGGQKGQAIAANFGINSNFSLPRNLSDDGSRLFFDSSDALVPGDTNGKQDVYEYEDGQVHLISLGRGGEDSYFFDASTSGDDVFFATDDELVGQDTDGLIDLYDARVDGGLASQNPPQMVSCQGDACKGPSSNAPPALVAAGVTFSGPGNAPPAALPAKPSVLARTVRGTRLLIKVRVPAEGRITITGAGIRTARRTVARGGVYKLAVALTPKARRALARRHRLRLRLRVGYAPPGARAQAAIVRVTVLPALAHKHGKRARRATNTNRRAGK